MSTQRQYVAVTFRPGEARTYTYHNDGAPLAIGDEVKVADNRSDGWKRVTVAAVDVAEPAFATKPILGPAPPRDDAAQTETF